MPKILMQLVVLAFLMPLGACSGHFSPAILDATGAIDAKVVDEDTGLPVEGANVVAIYETVRKTLGGRGTGTVLEVMETVTDAQGRLHFPAVTLIRISLDEVLEGDDPKVLVFKPGYDLRVIARSLALGYPNGIRGETVKMKRHPEDPRKTDQYFSYYQGLEDALHTAIESCNLVKIPNALKARDAEFYRLQRVAPGVFVDLLKLAELEARKKCPFATDHSRKNEK